MKTPAIFYHAGCPVCVEAERQIADALDPTRYDVELVHLGEHADRIAPFHINYGAPLSALKS